MEFDLWFARDDKGQLWYTIAETGSAPDVLPVKIKTVHDAYRLIREAGCSIAQVGVADIEMLRI